MNIYNYKLVCRCPNDSTVNIYDVIIKSKQIIQVEDFNKFQSKIYNEKYYQEQIYELLKDCFGDVKVIGTHLGVKVISQKWYIITALR